MNKVILTFTIFILINNGVRSLPVSGNIEGIIKLDVPAELLVGRKLILTLEDVPDSNTGTTDVPIAIISTTEADQLLQTNSTQNETDQNIKRIIQNGNPDTSEFIFNVQGQCPEGYLPDLNGKCRPIFTSNSNKLKTVRRNSISSQQSKNSEISEVVLTTLSPELPVTVGKMTKFVILNKKIDEDGIKDSDNETEPLSEAEDVSDDGALTLWQRSGVLLP